MLDFYKIEHEEDQGKPKGRSNGPK
jgi:hypothetical protein